MTSAKPPLVKLLHTVPAKVAPTLTAVHVWTTTILLDVLLAPRTRTRELANLLERLLLFFLPILGPELVCFAGLTDMVGPVASRARLSSAGVAGTDVCQVRVVICNFDCRLPEAANLLSLLRRLLDRDFGFVDLAFFAAGSQAPAPVGGRLADVLAL